MLRPERSCWQPTRPTRRAGASRATSAARARLTALANGLDGALRAIEATTDTDGLTWAKPAWHVKYLMDQSEVYAGLQAAKRLFTSLA